MTESQLDYILRKVGIYEKSGHRVKLFALFSILKSKKRRRSLKRGTNIIERNMAGKCLKTVDSQPLNGKNCIQNDLLSELHREVFITSFHHIILKIMFYLKDQPVGQLFKKL